MTEGRADQDHHGHGPPKMPQNLVFEGPVRNRRRTPSPPVQSASAENDTRSESARPPPSGMGNANHVAPEPKTGESSTLTAEHSAATGIRPLDAKTKGPITSMNVWAAENQRTERRTALSQRRLKPLTLLVADRWHRALKEACLLSKYPLIPEYIRLGAHAGIPQIQKSYAPPLIISLLKR